jgi:hypothetical protein
MIKYAVDEYGNLCCADDSNAPQHVKCPLCGASEYRRNSPLGNPYYALFPGEVHKYEACRTLDGSVDILDLLSTKLDRFRKHFWGAGKSTPGGPEGPEAPNESNAPEDSVTPDEPVEPTESDDSVASNDLGASGVFDDAAILFASETPPQTKMERMRGMRTLRDLAATGLLDCNDREMEGGWQLSDLTINPRFAYVLLDMQNVGERILQGRPQVYIDRDHIIRFKINIEANRYGRYIKKFKIADIRIPDDALYTKIRDMLFEHYTDEFGKDKVRWKYDRVAIAGNWACIPRGACYCGWGCEKSGWSCTGLLYSEILKVPCIYPFPDSRLEYDAHSHIPKKRQKF